MNLPYSASLEIAKFEQLFKDVNQSYKFFWFKAILSNIQNNKTVITYDEILNEMIASAWYMVAEYHLNLGPSDTMEKLISEMKILSGLKSSEKKERIIEYLKKTNDKKILNSKKQLSLNVPYRLLVPFCKNITEKEFNGSKEFLISKINSQEGILYQFGKIEGLQTTIIIQKNWAEYIKTNFELIKGWANYKLISYLQIRNPNVPGIIEKLEPPYEREMKDVQKYWKTISEIHPLIEIYENKLITKENISIDHFIPWSFVAYDEFWNLHPTTRSINSSKSNDLPTWEYFFPRLAKLEFDCLQLHEKPQINQLFENCLKNNLHNEEITRNLYRRNISEMEFRNRLENIMQPIYQSAQNSGFDIWKPSIYTIPDSDYLKAAESQPSYNEIK